MGDKQLEGSAKKALKKEKQQTSRRQETTKRPALSSKIWWRRLKRDYKVRFIHDEEEESKRNTNNETKKPKKRPERPQDRFKLLDKHLTIDQLAARQKLDQLKLLTRTDLSIANSAEPYRVSGFVEFKRNLIDPFLYLSITFTYLLSKSLAHAESYLFFILVFTCLFSFINYHIDSYRSFKVINKSVEVLSENLELRKLFLSTHLGYNPRRKFTKTRPGEVKLENTQSINSAQPLPEIDEPELMEECSHDTFHWINMIIVFFWPYLSHIIHYELNEFFKDQIESGSLANSEQGIKRLFYAILRQLDTNILVIERCQLGHHAPFVKNLLIYETKQSYPIVNKHKKLSEETKPKLLKGDENRGGHTTTGGFATKATKIVPDPEGKTLVCDMNLEYNGDMNIAVIYRYFCCLSSRVGLKDIFLRFKLRCTLGPITSAMPFVEQITVTLLELPEFGYKGIALAELAELKIVRGVINRLITENLLNPRKITVTLSDLLRALINGPPKKETVSSSKSKAETHKRLALSQSRTRNDTSGDVSFLTRMTAKLVLCSCMCSNICLRCCSKRDLDERDKEDEDGEETVS